MLAAIAALAAAYYAAVAADAASTSAREAVELNRYTLDAGRPYLSIESAAYDAVTERTANFTLLVKNVGARPAMDVASRTTVMRVLGPGEGIGVGVVTFGGVRYSHLADSSGALANDLAPSQQRVILPAEISTNSNATYLVVTLSYEDPAIGERLPPQRFFYAIGSEGLSEASRAERSQLEPYFVGIVMDNGEGGEVRAN